MKDNKFSEVSTEELLKNEKSLKTITYIFAGVLTLLFIINIFLVYNKGFSVSNVIPIALLPILIFNLSTLNEIKKELKSRE
ncbi:MULTISPECIES: hypothetical protein [unclassified Flavobacterium]|uniref:hypothetical protein n=1 Tax=unclassified Flavobacterium TaxID=196869 RepID=UPI00049361F7|nr:MULTISPECIES: hypothetical protein [unclassified Flavobacterium]MBF4494754.1 redox-active disulfide protein 2 [Flavobacterium sp. MR2016-29]